MLIPCDDCAIKDICGLVGSRKRAANKIDRIMEDVEDAFLEIPIICKRHQAEKDLPFPVGESTDRDLQEVLSIPRNRNGDIQDDDGDLPGVSSGTISAE